MDLSKMLGEDYEEMVKFTNNKLNEKGYISAEEIIDNIIDISSKKCKFTNELKRNMKLFGLSNPGIMCRFYIQNKPELEYIEKDRIIKKKSMKIN